MMNPLQISAQFAAYVWFTNQEDNAGKPQEDAHQFARQNWARFLPNAHEGLGRLLMQIAAPSAPSRVRCKARREETPVGVGV